MQLQRQAWQVTYQLTQDGETRTRLYDPCPSSLVARIWAIEDYGYKYPQMVIVQIDRLW